MAAHDVRGPLPRTLLGRLAPRPESAVADPELLAADLALLRESGYLKLALPARLGGAGLNLRQVACAQRQLAARAPAAALAVNAHHAWVGAAADTLASGGPPDPVIGWLLREAAEGRFVAGHPGPATAAASGLDGLGALAGDPPGWDWSGTQVTDDSAPGRAVLGYAFTRRRTGSGPGEGGPRRTGTGPADSGRSTGPAEDSPRSTGPGEGTRHSTGSGRAGGRWGASPVMTLPGLPGNALVAGMFGWALPLAGMTWYAIGRRAFELAVERAQTRAGGAPAAGRDDPGHPLDQWPVTEAALRLDSIRAQLDQVIGGWERRASVGGAVTSLDPGGQWLIRLFTVRYAAADGTRRVIELAGQITGQATGHAGYAGAVGPLGPVPGHAR